MTESLLPIHHHPLLPRRPQPHHDEIPELDSQAPTARRSHTRPACDSSGHWRQRHDQLLEDCGLVPSETWDRYVEDVRTTRSRAGQPLARWSAAHLLTALELAVRGRGWPAEHAAAALLQVATDPTTRSPSRLAEAGPWWDQPEPEDAASAPAEVVDTDALERELDAVDGMRTRLQAQARATSPVTATPSPAPPVVARADLTRHGHAVTRAARPSPRRRTPAPRQPVGRGGAAR